MPEPVTLAEAKARLGIRTAARDAELTRLIKAAREHVEDLSGHLLVRRSHQIKGTAWSGREPLRLHVEPVHALTAVNYFTLAGALPVAGAVLIGGDRVFPAEGQSWPYAPYGYAVEVDAGYEPGEEPEQLIQALLLLVGHWFENHEAVVVGTSAVELPVGVRDLCSQFREPGFS